MSATSSCSKAFPCSSRKFAMRSRRCSAINWLLLSGLVKAATQSAKEAAGRPSAATVLSPPAAGGEGAATARIGPWAKAARRFAARDRTAPGSAPNATPSPTARGASVSGGKDGRHIATPRIWRYNRRHTGRSSATASPRGSRACWRAAYRANRARRGGRRCPRLSKPCRSTQSRFRSGWRAT